MPRTWGYIVILVAVVIGAGALLLPVPEPVEVDRIEEPSDAGQGTRQPVVPPRIRSKQPAARITKPPTPPIPPRDTTKTRQLVQPKPKE